MQWDIHGFHFQSKMELLLLLCTMLRGCWKCLENSQDWSIHTILNGRFFLLFLTELERETFSVSVSSYLVLYGERVGGKQAGVLLNTRLKGHFLAALCLEQVLEGAVPLLSLRASSSRNAGNAGVHHISEQRRWYLESVKHCWSLAFMFSVWKCFTLTVVLKLSLLSGA